MRNHSASVTMLVLVLLIMAAGKVPAQQEEASAAGTPPGAVVLETDLVRIEIAPEGHILRLADKASGEDYALREPSAAFARVRAGGKDIAVSTVRLEDGRLLLDFGEEGGRAVLGVTASGAFLVLEVLSFEGEGADALTFLDIPLTLEGRLDEAFAACVLALNLQTNVAEIPGPSSRLRATCCRRFGFVGAKAAIIACPQARLREVMKEVVLASDEIPHSNIGGPWALDADISRGSYLFDFGQCTEKTVDDWIALVQSLGLTQIDFHTGHSLRFGDYTPHPDLFPKGRASVRAVTDKLHAAGIAAGLHTYAFFIAKGSPYVTPVPDRRLGYDAIFTLADALTAADAATVPVDESTQTMSTTTGFFVRNSVTLRIDDELITYSGVAKETPYAFTGCTRGAFGTAAAAHAKGAQVFHLKECFGLFTPDAESTLLEEVAENTATAFNECGFDMIYLDALDGEDILGGGENAWHYGSKFVFEIAKRLEKPALFEMSTFHHHLWYVRARMGAWDHPNRSHKRFIDIHAAANQSGSGMMLPMNLGWWAVKTWNGPRNEPTYPDDIEYLMGKCLGNDMGLALMGVNPDNIGSVPAYQRLAPIFKQYEDLRHSGYFPESVKAQLRTPGAEFTLEEDGQGGWRFRKAHYAKHKVQGMDGWSNAWTTANPFGEQPLGVRIQVLMSAAPYDSEDAIVIADFRDGQFSDTAQAASVSGTLAASTEQVKVGERSGRISALNQDRDPNGAWLKWGAAFAPEMNLAKNQALGVWVYGDGRGELLNLQLKSPEHIAGGIGDHYISVDFEGWRYIELMEHEGGRIDDFTWPYGGAYGIYREDVSFAHISAFSIWYNNLPKGEEATCHLSPIKALPTKTCVIRNARISIAGKTITFPGEIETGQYLELQAGDACTVYGRQDSFTIL